MKQKKNTLWTMDRQHAAGFTLVELIVVIAILAILAGIGIPAYSGYITKTNQQADQTLVSEVRNAMTLALYDQYGHVFSDTIVVKLSQTEAAQVVSATGSDTDENIAKDIELVEAAMEKAFGSNWAEACKLKYGEWPVDTANVTSYKGSSFDGNEEELLGTVSYLSGALARFFAAGRNIPSHIKEVMNKNGLDASNTNGVANSAVLALAGNLTEAGNAVQSEVVGALTDIEGCYGPDENGYWVFQVSKMSDKVREAYSKYYGEFQEDGTYLLDDEDADMVTLATTATLYAYAEGFAQYTGNAGDDTAANILANIEYEDENGNPLNSGIIALNVDNAMKQIADYAVSSTASSAAQNYFNGTNNAKDANAFFSVMDAVDKSSGTLSSDIGSADCFTNAGNLLAGYIAAGSVLADGEAGVIVNLDKSIVAYLGGIQK